jgi:hypothetical protein
MKMLPFLETVREIVLPRLPSALLRRRAEVFELQWQPRDVQTKAYDLMALLQAGGDYLCDYAVTHRGLDGKYIRLHSDVNCELRPFGEKVAYTLIHELGHAATLGDHNSPEWVYACRLMGIDEHLYNGDYKVMDAPAFGWLDHSLLLCIRNLSSYPGDVA